MRVALFFLLLAGGIATGLLLQQSANRNRALIGVRSVTCARPDPPASARPDPLARGIVDLELAFTPGRVGKLLARGPGPGEGTVCGALVGQAGKSLRRGTPLIASYLVTLTALCLLVAKVFAPGQRRPWHVVTALPAVAALFDLGSNLLLQRVLNGSYWLAPWASLAGAGKFFLLAATLIALVIVAASWLGKLLSVRRTRKAASLDKVIAAEESYLAERRTRAEVGQRDQPIGLALSGGGLRSATLNLGVLQALAKRRFLPLIDYLSTVSGGGYIGSALSSLLSVNGSPIADSKRGDIEQYRFAPEDSARFTTANESFPFNERFEPDEPGLGGRAQLRHLRSAGEFLVGARQLFSTEMLRTIGSLLVGMLYHFLHFGLLLVAFSAAYLGIVHQTVGDRATRFTASSPAPGHAAPWRAEPTGGGSDSLRESYGRLVDEAFGLDLTGLGLEHPFFLALVVGFIVTLLSHLLAELLLPRLPDRWFERPGTTSETSRENAAITVMMAIMIVVGFGVLGRWVGAQYRESLLINSSPLMSYLGGGLYLVIVNGWVRASQRIDRAQRSRLAAQTGTVVILVLISLVLVFGILTFVAFFEALTDYVVERPFLSLLGWLALLLGAQLLGEKRWDPAAQGPLSDHPALVRGLRKLLALTFTAAAILGPVLLICAWIWRIEPAGQSGPFRWLAFGLALALFALTGWVDFDRLSLHFLYRDRLADAFLRTTGSTDVADPLATLRDNAALELRDLHGRSAEKKSKGCVTSAPYHLLVGCLNLTAGRQRKQAVRTTDQFIFSRLYCGSESTGFVETERYRDGDTRLADAMTISGAAVSAALSAAATLLNLRLGRWLENPAFQGVKGGTRPRRTFWTPYLLRELLASADAHHRLVYLSDGGHSGDNLGIYPLLRRRCRLIVAIDAGHDPRYTCASLAKAISQIKIDDDVSVDIELNPLRPDAATGLSAAHWVTGEIEYPDDKKGWLFVLKSSLTGREPAAIDSYRKQNDTFPHQSTAELYFDWEQFEAYRLLGEHMTGQLLDHLCDRNADWSGDLPKSLLTPRPAEGG